MAEELNTAVECHSGSQYAEYPTAVVWQGARLEVETVIDRQRTPDGKVFRVRVKDGREFSLTYHESSDAWQVELC